MQEEDDHSGPAEKKPFSFSINIAGLFRKKPNAGKPTKKPNDSGETQVEKSKWQKLAERWKVSSK